MVNIKKLFKEPLLHFILLGGLLFAVYIYLNPQSIQDNEEIVVSEGKVLSISRKFIKKWNRPPTRQELKALIDEYVLTEAYYKEAIKLGLDKNDPAVKRRMRQKIEFVTSDALSLIDVNDEMLQKFMVDNADKYQKEGIYSFDQIYINPNTHMDDLKAHILKIKVLLDTNSTVQSDSTMLQTHYDNISASRLNNEFGRDFAKKLDPLKRGEWSKNIQSGLGVHFVKITQRKLSRPYQLNEVRDAVLRDFLYQKRKGLLDAERKNIVSKYKVSIDLKDASESNTSKEK